MAEENVVRKRTREEDRQQEDSHCGLLDAKRVHTGSDAGLMAFLDRIDNMDKNDEEKNNVVKSLEADETNLKESVSSFSLENNNFNFNDGFIDVAEELEMSYFHFCDEEGGLMAVYSTHHGFVPDYTEVNDLCHGETLWEDDIWHLNDEIFRYTC